MLNLPASHSTGKCGHSTTFRVHSVEPASTLLPTTKLPGAISLLLGNHGRRNDTRLESCCDYTTSVITGVVSHPLIAATHQAFSEHRSLVLSPDMLWLAILQGIAQHVHVDPEASRDTFVPHQGRKKVEIERVEPLVAGSPENPWSDIVSQFSLCLRNELGERYDRFECEFSTTGSLERIACQIAVMDVLEPYYEFVMRCICGIPEITLEGSTDDWQTLRDRAQVLNDVGLNWWHEALDPILDEFHLASGGAVNLDFWRNIHKRQDAYGETNINGWMVKFVPYTKGEMGVYNVRNRLLSDPDAMTTASSLPSGISVVPIHHDIVGADGQPARAGTFELLGGFLGVTQNEETGALRPKLGWAVRRCGIRHRIYQELEEFNPAPSAGNEAFQSFLWGDRKRWILEYGELNLSRREILTRRPAGPIEFSGSFPVELVDFYRFCDGVEIFPGPHSVRFHALRECDAVNELPVLGTAEIRPADHPLPGSTEWVRFCTMADGTFAMIACYPIRLRQYKYGKWVVLGGPHAEIGGELPIVARGFDEFVRRILDSEGDHSKLRRYRMREAIELGSVEG
ncbi:MAG: DUF4419 domain-containing protein [Planctomycetes bacterium]|nr:DUF4419 domain-containing protein [Planctomycetota bacterium]